MFKELLDRRCSEALAHNELKKGGGSTLNKHSLLIYLFQWECLDQWHLHWIWIWTRCFYTKDSIMNYYPSKLKKSAEHHSSFLFGRTLCFVFIWIYYVCLQMSKFIFLQKYSQIMNYFISHDKTTEKQAKCPLDFRLKLGILQEKLIANTIE